MEQKGSKVQEARKILKRKSGPESLHSGADFGTGKEPLARQKSGAEPACSGANFEAQEEPFGSTKIGCRTGEFGRRFCAVMGFWIGFFLLAYLSELRFSDQGFTNFET